MRLKCVEKRGGGGNGDKEKERRKINERGERSCGSWVMVYEDGNRLRQQREHATSFRERQHEKTPQGRGSRPHADLVSGSRCDRFRVDRRHSFAHSRNTICALHSGESKFFCSSLVICECKWNVQGWGRGTVIVMWNTKNVRHKFLKDQEEEGWEKKKKSYWLRRTPIVSRTMDADKPWLL